MGSVSSSEKRLPWGCGALSISDVTSPMGYLGARKNKFNSWLSAELQILLTAKALMLFMFKACFLAEKQKAWLLLFDKN